MDFLFLTCLVSTILVVLYLTDAVPTYLKWGLKGYKALLIDEYFQNINIPCENYLEYLNFKYDSFWLKLASCPFCLGFWLSLLASLFSVSLDCMPCIYIMALILFFLIRFLAKKV